MKRNPSTLCGLLLKSTRSMAHFSSFSSYEKLPGMGCVSHERSGSQLEPLESDPHPCESLAVVPVSSLISVVVGLRAGRCPPRASIAYSLNSRQSSSISRPLLKYKIAEYNPGCFESPKQPRPVLQLRHNQPRKFKLTWQWSMHCAGRPQISQ